MSQLNIFLLMRLKMYECQSDLMWTNLHSSLNEQLINSHEMLFFPVIEIAYHHWTELKINGKVTPRLCPFVCRLAPLCMSLCTSRHILKHGHSQHVHCSVRNQQMIDIMCSEAKTLLPEEWQIRFIIESLRVGSILISRNADCQESFLASWMLHEAVQAVI